MPQTVSNGNVGLTRFRGHLTFWEKGVHENGSIPRKDGGPDRRGVGFYFRNVTELLPFGVRGTGARTLQPARSMPNMIAARKREHSRKPDEQYEIIERRSWGPYLELFARCARPDWRQWGNELESHRGTRRVHGGYGGGESIVPPSGLDP